MHTFERRKAMFHSSTAIVSEATRFKAPRCAVGVFALFFLLGCDDRWSNSAVRATEKNGDQIVAALRKFERENGKYPATLEELIPKYTTSIRPPEVGEKRWVYQCDGNGGDFELHVKSREQEPNYEHMECFHNGEWGEWHLHRGF